jgi:hypothetical protein
MRIHSLVHHRNSLGGLSMARTLVNAHSLSYSAQLLARGESKR